MRDMHHLPDMRDMRMSTCRHAHVDMPEWSSAQIGYISEGERGRERESESESARERERERAREKERARDRQRLL